MTDIQKKAEEYAKSDLKNADKEVKELFKGAPVLTKMRNQDIAKHWLAGYLAGQQKTGGLCPICNGTLHTEIRCDKCGGCIDPRTVVYPPTGEPGEPVDLSNTNWMTDENKKTFLKSIQGEDQEALKQAVAVIKGWHNFPANGIRMKPEEAEAMWKIYYEKSPEMKLIREKLPYKPE